MHKFEIGRFATGFLITFGLAIAWDLARGRQPGFLVQSLASYADLPLSLPAIWDRLLGFAALLRYGTGSPVLNSVLAIGWPLLLLVGVASASNTSDAWKRSEACADLMLSAFMSLFVAGHALVAFVIWDRYLLGLIPLLALLLARVLMLPWRLSEHLRFGRWLGVLFVLAMVSFTLRPLRDAAASRFPIGGDHGAYQGIEQIVGYLQTVPADTTLYHRWLGWHWRFYLWGSPYDFRAWSSPEDLAAQAAARPGARRYVVFPSWHSSSEARLALADAGLVMREVQRAFRDDGSVSFIVYRIEEAP
jgi:hypothetical protein